MALKILRKPKPEEAKVTRIMGIDPSTYTGLACVDSEGAIVGSKLINYPKAKGFERLQLIARGVENVMQEWSPEIILIEGYAFGNKNTLVTLVEVGTAIRLVLRGAGIPWLEVPPTVLKKFTTGVGNAKKPQMAEAVKERWGFESKSDDVIDAYALAALGQELALTEFKNLPKGVYYAS